MLAINGSITSCSSSHRCIFLDLLIWVRRADELLPSASPNLRPALSITIIVHANATDDLIEVLMVSHAATWRVIIDPRQLTARSLRQIKRLSQLVVKRFEPFLSLLGVIQAEIPAALRQALLSSRQRIFRAL